MTILNPKDFEASLQNRVNTKLKEGKSKEVAEKEAFEEFSAIAEETQQSADIQDKDAFQRGGIAARALQLFVSAPRQMLRI